MIPVLEIAPSLPVLWTRREGHERRAKLRRWLDRQMRQCICGKLPAGCRLRDWTRYPAPHVSGCRCESVEYPHAPVVAQRV